MKPISGPAATPSSRSISSAEEIKPEGDYGTFDDRWEHRLLGGILAGLVVAASAAVTSLVLWSLSDVSTDVLGYVFAGGVCCSFFLLHVLRWYDGCKDDDAPAEETASNLV